MRGGAALLIGYACATAQARSSVPARMSPAWQGCLWDMRDCSLRLRREQTLRKETPGRQSLLPARIESALRVRKACGRARQGDERIFNDVRLPNSSLTGGSRRHAGQDGRIEVSPELPRTEVRCVHGRLAVMRGREKSRFSTIFGSACQAWAWRTEGIIPDPHCRKQCAAAVIRDRCGKDGLPLDIQRPRSPFRVKKNTGVRAGGEEYHKSPATPQTMRRHAFMRSGGNGWFSLWFGFQPQAWETKAAAQGQD